MPLRYLIDEQLRGPFWTAIRAQMDSSSHPIDATCIGETDAPALGTKDPELLAWCASQGRILVSKDKSTLPVHLADLLASGRDSPGIFIVRPSAKLDEVLEHLEVASECSEPNEWTNCLDYIPPIP